MTDLVLSYEANKSMPSPFWQQVRRLRGNEQEEQKWVKDQNNSIRKDPKGKKEALRQYWQEIFKIQPEDNINFDQENPPIAPVKAEEVKARISNLKKKKSPGASKINAQILQHLTPNFIEQITNIFNACISTGHMPKAFKEAIIVLIPKGKGDTTNLSNYRPISLLENIEKIIERIINEKLQGHPEEHNLLNKR